MRKYTVLALVLVLLPSVAAAQNVVVSSSVLPTGAATSANQTSGDQQTQVVDASGNVVSVTSNRLHVIFSELGTAGTPHASVLTVQGITSMTPLQVTQSGTWTLQPGNTANTTAWLVTEDVNSQISTDMGEVASAIETTTLNKMRSLLVDANGDVLTLASDYTVNAAADADPSGPTLLMERDDALSALTEIEGDWTNLRSNANGAAWVTVDGSITCTNCSGSGVSVNEDVASANADPGTPSYTVRNDTVTGATGADGDYQPMKSDSAGRVYVTGAGGSFPVTDSGGTLTVDGTVTVTDGAGALNVIVDSGDPCAYTAKTFIPINISTATTTELTASLAGASTHYYVCSLNLLTAGANNVALVDDDTDDCASVTSGLSGGTTAASGWNFAANGGIVTGSGTSAVMRTNGTNRVLCLVTSAATQLSGHMTVVAAQ